VVCAAALAAVAPADASQLIARNASDVTLEVDARGVALLRYVRGGRFRQVRAWGAVDARPPRVGGAQVSFHLVYSSGRSRLANVCGPYTGPRLRWLVAACTARDGSHWAVQSWRRSLPVYGARARGLRAARELRLSHWRGAPARLTVHLNWAYGRFDHLFGTLTYRGVPVHGFASTPRGRPLDPFGRNVYVDTLDSAYGPGWRRENGFLTHRPTGAFCYGFYRHGSAPAGTGRRYRATVVGPGVTPDVSWVGRPRPYDRERDLALHRRQRVLYARDSVCDPV
jgi:hypothetical protein